MILTASQVLRYALQAGFTAPEAITATAIAHAESGFNDQAIGDVALEDDFWGPSVGLWQIRTLKNPVTAVRNIDRLLSNPEFQAQSAYAISAQGTNFQPWSTFTNRAYLRYMNEAIRAFNAVTTESQQENNMQSTIVAFEPTPTGHGYWLIFSDGAIFSYGDAQYLGRAQLVNGVWQPIYPTQQP